jgi:crossover junction endodeoxyribonuclease RuvC
LAKNITILGIDCGVAITGWAIMEAPLISSKKINQPELVDYGIIETHKFSPEEHRLKDLGQSIQQLIKQYKPNHLAIEDLFFFKNAKTAMKVSQARGVVIYLAAQNNLEYHSYTPLQVKQHITGYGRAQKNQVIFMVNKIFSLGKKKIQDDAADAIAVAYSHFLRLGVQKS